MMGMRISAGLLAVLAVEVPTADPIVEMAKLFGLTGLLVWFVFWSRKDKEASDRRWEDTNEKMFGVIREQTEAAKESADAQREQTKIVGRLVEELEKRHCLHEHIKALD